MKGAGRWNFAMKGVLFKGKGKGKGKCKGHWVGENTEEVPECTAKSRAAACNAAFDLPFQGMMKGAWAWKLAMKGLIAKGKGKGKGKCERNGECLDVGGGKAESFIEENTTSCQPDVTPDWLVIDSPMLPSDSDSSSEHAD